MIKKIIPILLFIIFIPIVFAYNVEIQINSNIADFHTDVYKCSNFNCNYITNHSSSNTGTTQNSYNLFGTGDHYYVEYDYKSCYEPHIYTVHVWGDVKGTYPFDITFEKKPNCEGTIKSLSAFPYQSIIGTPITITINVQSTFEYPNHVPQTTVIPENIQDEYSAKTKITFYANGDLIYQIEEEILLSLDKEFSFKWTPPQPGTYAITAVTEVTDCACLSQTNKSESIIIKVQCTDNDQDEYYLEEGCGTDVDCDDNNPNIYSGAQEVCNGLDDDCDSIIDDGENDLCDDGLYCNGAEVCAGELGCRSGIPVGCSDSNECTDDICNEDLNQCENPNLPAATLCGQEKDCPPDGCSGPFVELYPDDSHDTCDGQGNCIGYSCVMEDSYCSDNDPNDGINGNICDAECDQDTDCNATDCDSLDGCIGNDYYDYRDVENDCVNCLCKINQCEDPTIYETDPKCTECQTDDDCNDLNNDYCDGDVIKHDKRRCINYKCEVETIEVEDCSQKNGIMNYCGLIVWDCSEELNRVDCVVTNIKPDDDLCPDSCQGTVRNNGFCNSVTYNCDYIQEDCNDYDTVYCDGGLIKRDDYICTILNSSGWAPPPPSRANCVLNEKEIIQNCDDGLYCNGEETCDNAQCKPGTDINCSDTEFCTLNERCDEALDKCLYDVRDCLANDLILIETCDNDPDNNPFTWDYFAGFTLVCDEDNDKCTTGDSTITHTCDIEKCGAECKDDSDCGLSETCNLDTCECEATCIPEEEVCDGLIDEDCDGITEEDCECTIGKTRYCPFQDGVCKGSTETCTAQGKWPGCDYSAIPGYETTESTCNDLKDNDCDGLIDINDPNCMKCVDNDKDSYNTIRLDCPSGNDCDDTDPKINPGAKEISDGKDNDCDGSIDEGIIKYLVDKLPRQKFLISKIRTNKVEYDEIKAGDLLFVDLTFENIGRQDTKQATIRITIPELGISKKLGPFNGPEIDEVMFKGLYLEIPKDAKPGVYSVRISLSDINGIRRTRHRDFRIIE